MPITNEQIDALKAAHPDDELHLLSSAEVDMELVVKAPRAAEWKLLRSRQADEAKKPTAMRDFLLACLIEPSPQAFTAVLAQRPGLAETFGVELLEIGGLSRDAVHRKL